MSEQFEYKEFALYSKGACTERSALDVSSELCRPIRSMSWMVDIRETWNAQLCVCWVCLILLVGRFDCNGTTRFFVFAVLDFIRRYSASEIETDTHNPLRSPVPLCDVFIRCSSDPASLVGVIWQSVTRTSPLLCSPRGDIQTKISGQAVP